MRASIFLISTLFISSIAYSATYYIPGDYGTIQGTIQASANGDTLIVGPGVYKENINFLGKAVTLKSAQGASSTCIDGNLAGSVVTCNSGEVSTTVLEGFAIYNGYADYGGGMHNTSFSSPTVIQCLFLKNTANYDGGAVYNSNGSSPTIIQCTFYENTANNNGGGICNDNSAPTITNNII